MAKHPLTEFLRENEGRLVVHLYMNGYYFHIYRPGMYKRYGGGYVYQQDVSRWFASSRIGNGSCPFPYNRDMEI